MFEDFNQQNRIPSVPSQTQAIRELLECSATIKIKQVGWETGKICPWPTVKQLIKRYSATTQHRKQLFSLESQAAQNKFRRKTRYEPRQTTKQLEESLTCTPTHQIPLRQMEVFPLKDVPFSTVINLNRELEKVHTKRKQNFILKQRVHRIKTCM